MDVTTIARKVVSKVCHFKTAAVTLAVCAFASFGIPAFAQETAKDITLTVPEINYAGVASSLMTSLIPVVLAAIGIGLSIWVITLLYRMFRSMGK